ncbi:class I adenylate-forming enzyme family protein [Halosolutus amylolyticus]|uniref:Class I adenylate-forming enzyme family protein n=1 Tax=Halosolutus amylolyticus TaxID=2932267 RepID=A0ABD5PIK4_9EURY|nr:class I adenylate-forming enzyme family protein [Halosolutus amylolyticus]
MIDSNTHTLKAALNQATEWYPEKEVFVQAFSDDRRNTYVEFNDDCRKMANAYLEDGIEKGDRIVFVSDTTVEHAVAYFAALKVGAIPANLHTRAAVNVNKSLIDELEPETIVFQPKYTDDVEAFETDDVKRLIALDSDAESPSFASNVSEFVEGAPETEPDVNLQPSDDAFINFTSGTTGKPKGMVRSHEEAIEFIQTATYIYQSDRTDVYLNPFGTGFIGWPLFMLSCSSMGATVVCMDEFAPARVPELIESEGITFTIITPTMWKMILQHGDADDYDLSSLDRVGYAGEAISTDVYKRLQDQYTENVLTVYGGTDPGFVTVLFPEEVTEQALESVGRPVMNHNVRIIEPESKDPTATVEPGEIGEIIARGPSTANRVYNRPEKTEELFDDDGWWYGGDLARIGTDGNIYLEGRVDNMIISGGVNVYAEAVETVLDNHPAIHEVAVIGMPDEKWGERVTAYVISDDGSLTENELEQWCRDNDDLGDYQRPREFIFRDELPRSNTGKLDRDSLRSDANS